MQLLLSLLPCEAELSPSWVASQLCAHTEEWLLPLSAPHSSLASHKISTFLLEVAGRDFPTKKHFLTVSNLESQARQSTAQETGTVWPNGDGRNGTPQDTPFTHARPLGTWCLGVFLQAPQTSTGSPSTFHVSWLHLPVAPTILPSCSLPQ